MKTAILLTIVVLFSTSIVSAAQKGPEIPSGTPMTIKVPDETAAAMMAKKVVCVCIESNCCCGEVGKPCQWCGGPRTCEPKNEPAK